MSNIFLKILVKIDEAGQSLATSHWARSRHCRTFFIVFTQLGSGVLWVLTYVLFLIFSPQHALFPVYTLLYGEGFGFLVVVFLRYGFCRPRPDPSYAPFFLAPWNRFSFPSHHSLRAFFVAVVLGENICFLLPWLLLLAVLISLSRVLLLRHYVSDVLVGAMIGVGIGLVCMQLV